MISKSLLGTTWKPITQMTAAEKTVLRHSRSHYYATGKGQKELAKETKPRAIPTKAVTEGKGKVRVTGYEGDGRFSAITNRDEKIVRSRDAYKFQKRATIERRETWLGPGERWDIKDEQGKKVGDTGTYPKRFGMKSHYGHEDNGLKRWDHGGVGDTTVKPKYRGKGYSTDARIARTQESKHKKIYSSINTTNIASIKSAEKAGGKPIRTHTRKDGVNRVVYVHKKTVSKGLPSAVKAAKADKLLQPMLGRADAKDANHYRYLLHRSQANSKGREYGKDLARGNSDGKQYYLGPGKAARTKSRTALEDAKNAFGVADTRSKQ